MNGGFAKRRGSSSSSKSLKQLAAAHRSEVSVERRTFNHTGRVNFDIETKLPRTEMRRYNGMAQVRE